MSIRRQCYALIEDEESPSPASRRIDAALLILIIVTVSASVVHTVEPLWRIYRLQLDAIEVIGVAVFTIEYALRLWVAVEDRAGRYEHPVLGRLRYALTPLALVDLLAILPFYLGLFLPADLLFLRTLRLLRILKLARYSPALALFEVVLLNQRRALLAALSIIVVLLIISAGLMYAAEHVVQPEAFASIPAAMWWAAVTMSTVGYGDVTPVTAVGKVIAGIVSMLGIVMFALPTAILGAGFTQELQKRSFTATAAMVARVPLFKSLPPAQLAEITALLHVRNLPPRFTVMRRGEHPDAMYFIDEGSVVVRADTSRHSLGAGRFFGERALLQGRSRRATIITLTSCRLLELRASDFHRLIGGDPSLRAAIAERTGEVIGDQGGDGGTDQTDS